jgi:WD40 repeat protein
VSGSRDATLRVWDVNEGTCLHVLVGHLAAVRCVQYDGRLVVSGAYDYMVKVWNPERQECLHTLQGHTNRVYSLQVRNIIIRIKVWQKTQNFIIIVLVWWHSCSLRFIGHIDSRVGRWNWFVQAHANGPSKLNIWHGVAFQHIGVRQCWFHS